jgi:molybdopterin-binding protein
LFRTVARINLSRYSILNILRGPASRLLGDRMKLSARNQIKGKVITVQRGQTTGHVRIDVGNGIVDDAVAVIKASDVMVAK